VDARAVRFERSGTREAAAALRTVQRGVTRSWLGSLSGSGARRAGAPSGCRGVGRSRLGGSDASGARRACATAGRCSHSQSHSFNCGAHSTVQTQFTGRAVPARAPDRVRSTASAATSTTQSRRSCVRAAVITRPRHPEGRPACARLGQEIVARFSICSLQPGVQRSLTASRGSRIIVAVGRWLVAVSVIASAVLVAAAASPAARRRARSVRSSRA
jgi:hypothetical protein